MELKIHPIQTKILNTLLFKEQARFKELNTTGLSTDHFTFHVNKLIKDGLISKNPEGVYLLTTRGKEFANRLDTEREVIERQPKVGVAVSCLLVENGRKRYLVQQRLKQPYFGYHGIVSGKIRWGEGIEQTARRELLEETGLNVRAIDLVGIEHKSDYNNDGVLLEDKIFFIFLGSLPRGKLAKEFKGGKNFWMTKNEILKLDKVFDDVPQLIKIFETEGRNKKPVFFENKFTVAEY
jgi:ADP-ribose pyrophosphatase YjhB (NUDIX family)/predicted transcriptional regulator